MVVVVEDNHEKILRRPCRKNGFFPDGCHIEIRYIPNEDRVPIFGHDNKPFTKTSLTKFMKDAISGKGEGGGSYEEMYPEINKPNVFSISTMAFDNWEFPPLMKQILWKTSGLRGEVPDDTDQMKQFRGTAQHEYFQERLVQRSIDWTREVEVRLHIPYKWKNLKNEDGTPCGEIILLGHADAVNFVSREILEFKTSDYSGRVEEYMGRQGGVYAAIMTDYFERAYKMSVIKVIGKEVCLNCNHADKTHIPQPTGEQICMPKYGDCYCNKYDGGILKIVQPDVAQVSDSVSEMLSRCYDCAKILDEGYYLNQQWVDDPEFSVWKEAMPKVEDIIKQPDEIPTADN